ncbi:uncharacterized protein [Eurosta solidaginis]|uniref:uncharacterized protein n=1 Tax=Eurosta solidaginis TaxID=178769 RepID=UPI0035306233
MGLATSAFKAENSIHQELQNYLRCGDFSSILEEYKQTNNLSDSYRRSLVRKCTNFLRKHCGNYPKREEKNALAESVIRLFPVYKVTNSKFGGIDLFYNLEDNSGYLVAKLQNINNKLNKISSGGNKKRKLSEAEKESDDDAVIPEQDLNFFQNCVVAEELSLVQQKLRETLKARQKFIATAVNVLEYFPIFLYDSSLIDFDFNLRYGEAISKGFLENCEKYESCVENIFIDASGESNLRNYTDWSSEVLPYLIFFKAVAIYCKWTCPKKQTFKNLSIVSCLLKTSTPQ